LAKALTNIFAETLDEALAKAFAEALATALALWKKPSQKSLKAGVGGDFLTMPH
jgi:hypothetical protein